MNWKRKRRRLRRKARRRALDGLLMSGQIGLLSGILFVCRRDETEQEVARLERRLAYPGGRKARRAERRLRAFERYGLDWYCSPSEV
jgi:hypothetical protein